MVRDNRNNPSHFQRLMHEVHSMLKMHLKQATSTYWKQWETKHEYEELKAASWLKPALALLREKTKEVWTETHRNVAKKMVLESWVQERLFDIGLSDESECQACHKEEGTEKHRLYHSQGWNEARRGIPEAFRNWEQKARTSKKEWKWQRGTVTQRLSESQWNRRNFSMRKWESEKHQS